MTLKQARSEIQSQMKYNCFFKYINFTKEFKYYISDYPIATTVYRCYGNGKLIVIDSDYAKQFIKKNKNMNTSDQKNIKQQHDKR